ncbi:MAG: LysR family transcriptional regulator [Myxococcales bacterium]|nr:LysR family transcriptional regulator [Myxococcales bacterium]
MAPPLPPLHALRCVEAAARAGTMAKAAAALGLTHGAISRQVRQVEDHLGVALFVRGPRALTPTRAGELVAAAVARGLSAIADGVAAARGLAGGPLVLSCEPTLTLAWLIPRLPRLPRRPPLEVHVVQGGGAIDLARAGVDVALRRGDVDLRGYHAAPVMDEWLGPVCAPRLAARARRGTAPTLHTRSRADAWASWRLATGQAMPRGPRRTFDHFATSLSAAAAGLGVAIGPYPLVHDQLAAGYLVAPWGFVRGELGYHLLTRQPLAEDPRAVALLAWLRAEAARTHRRLPRDPRRGAAPAATRTRSGSSR